MCRLCVQRCGDRSDAVLCRGAGWAQVVVWGAAGGCLGAAGGCPGAAGDTYWHALADLGPNKAPKGSTEVALGRLNASPRAARDISKAEKVEK